MAPSRLTPYALAFGDAGLDARHFPALSLEAAEHGVDTRSPARFAFLTLAADVLREMLPEDAPAAAREQLRALVFHAFNFWRAGQHTYLVDAPVVRYLVETFPALQNWEMHLPQTSIYVQLPRNLFWARVAPEATPEPLDGFFIVGDGIRLHMLLVLGLRADRAGFSLIPVDADVASGAPARWAGAPGRDQGRDFANILPGGELGRLYSVVTDAEALKLAVSVLWYIDCHPEDVVTGDDVHRVVFAGSTE